MIHNSESRLQNSRFRESGTRAEFSWELYVEWYENALEAVHFENSCTFIYKCMYNILPCCTTFLRSPVRKLSGCDPHFRPSHGVAHCADQRGPRVASGNSVLFRGKSKFCAVGYSVGRRRADQREPNFFLSRSREHDAFGRVVLHTFIQKCTRVFKL